MGDKVKRELVFGDHRILNIMYLRCLWDIPVTITACWSDKMSRQERKAW